MSSDRQVAANRANAKRSTGPRTLAGKFRSSGNAYQHGLSQPLQHDKGTRAKVEVIALALTGDTANDEQLVAATELAKAQVQLLRIRQRRANLLTAFDFSDTKKLRRLASLDRYERVALTARRRAGDELYNLSGSNDAASIFAKTNPIPVLETGLGESRPDISSQSRRGTTNNAWHMP